MEYRTKLILQIDCPSPLPAKASISTGNHHFSLANTKYFFIFFCSSSLGFLFSLSKTLFSLTVYIISLWNFFLQLWVSYILLRISSTNTSLFNSHDSKNFWFSRNNPFLQFLKEKKIDNSYAPQLNKLNKYHEGNLVHLHSPKNSEKYFSSRRIKKNLFDVKLNKNYILLIFPFKSYKNG